MKAVFNQSLQTTKKAIVRAKIMLPIIVSAVAMFVVLYIYCRGYNYQDASNISGLAAICGIKLHQLIQIAGFVFIVSAFAFFIPIIFYLFVGKKRATLRTSVHKDLKRIDPEYNKDVIDEKFKNVFDEKDYTLPVLFATSICFFGWLLVIFPHGPLLGDPDKFKEVLLVDLKNVIKGIRDNAPLVSYGFLGAYFYSIQLLYRRFLQSDLKPTVFMYVTMRVLISFIIVFVASLLIMSEIKTSNVTYMQICGAFAFFIGIFPTTGISWMQKKLSRLGFATRKMEDEQTLNLIEGLTIWDEARLLEEGIENVQNLATVNITDIIIKTRFNTDKLIDWIDQAYLIMHISSRINDWRKGGIRTASDFLFAYEKGDNGSLIKLAEKHEIELFHGSMQKGANIQLITSWWD